MSRLHIILSKVRRFMADVDYTLRELSWSEYKHPRPRRRWWRIS